MKSVYTYTTKFHETVKLKSAKFIFFWAQVNLEVNLEDLM